MVNSTVQQRACQEPYTLAYYTCPSMLTFRKGTSYKRGTLDRSLLQGALYKPRRKWARLDPSMISPDRQDAARSEGASDIRRVFV